MLFRSPVVRFFSRILNRVTITVVLVALQLLWLCWVAFAITTGTGRVWVNGLLNALSLLIVLYLVRKDENSAYKVGWIALIGILPLLGGALYLAFGNKRPAKRLRLKMQAVEDAHKKDLVQEPGVLEGLDAREQGQSRYVAKYGPYPAWQNTRTQYFACGEAMYPQLLADLEKAEKSIFLEFFIVSHGCMWNGIEKILRRKAAQGVDVRLIYDDFGSLLGLPADFIVRMERAHIRCIPFNPVMPLLSLVMNHRDHRKIAVIDGRVGFTGGVNLADEYINHIQKHGRWKDAAVMLEGEAVRSLTAQFLQMWGILKEPEYEQFLTRPIPVPENAKGVAAPYGDCPLDGERVGEMVYIDLLNRARDYIHIMTPYLILDGELETALKFAAERGVDVHLILPGKPDKQFPYALAKSHYSALLDSGVKISEWSPGFVHAKVFVVDDREAVVGTINLDYRSLYHHFEDAVWMADAPCIRDIEQDFQHTLEQCRTVENTSASIWQKHYLLRATGMLLKVIAPLL